MKLIEAMTIITEKDPQEVAKLVEAQEYQQIMGAVMAVLQNPTAEDYIKAQALLAFVQYSINKAKELPLVH